MRVKFSPFAPDICGSASQVQTAFPMTWQASHRVTHAIGGLNFGFSCTPPPLRTFDYENEDDDEDDLNIECAFQVAH